MKNPNPDALLILIADHISIPADVRRMEMTDKDRYERIRETLGEQLAIIEFARVEEGEAIKWLNEAAAQHSTKIEPEASRELVDSLGGDMMMISNELEKLLLYVGEKKRITLGDVETMVLAAKQRTLYELTDALSVAQPGARAGEFSTPCSPPETATKPPSAISTCWPAPSARCWSFWSATCATPAPSTRFIVAGFPYSAVCRRRRHPPIAPLQVAPRTYSRSSGSSPAPMPLCGLQSSKQASHPGEPDPRPRRRTQSNAVPAWQQEALARLELCDKKSQAEACGLDAYLLRVTLDCILHRYCKHRR
jgi:hypothetical protein